MTPTLLRGRYQARIAATGADLDQALDLRRLSFRRARGLMGDDSDRFDADCRHLLVMEGDRAVACCRLLRLTGGDIDHSYSAQFYDLERLAAFPGAMLELGRFCLHPEVHDPDILRLAWGALARVVDAEGVALLCGCSSFDGTDPGPYWPVFAHLSRRRAPLEWAPRAKAAEALDLRHIATPPDAGNLPPLLQTYLAMGAWVSDHAVIDRDLGTIHVFTGLEIAAIPPARARALRALAA